MLRIEEESFNRVYTSFDAAPPTNHSAFPLLYSLAQPAAEEFIREFRSD